MFTRSGENWTEQAKLAVREEFREECTEEPGSEESGGCDFGASVALSSDGNTALIGGPRQRRAHGAAWVFTRSGSTWTQQGAKLTGGEESGEGSLRQERGAVLRRQHRAGRRRTRQQRNRGAAWVFTRSGETWTQQGPKLTGGEETGEGYFGSKRGAVRRRQHRPDRRPARQGESAGRRGCSRARARSWTQQGPKLTPTDEVGRARFGRGVALSADGNTALIGGPRRRRRTGSGLGVHALGRNLGAAGQKLTPGGRAAQSSFGSRVALSAVWEYRAGRRAARMKPKRVNRQKRS